MRIVLILLILAVSFSLTSAQTSLKGKITDSISEQPIAAALIKVYKNGMLSARTYTNSNGNYHILRLDPGTYDIKIFKFGYYTETFKKQVLLADDTRKLNAVLNVIITEYKQLNQISF